MDGVSNSNLSFNMQIAQAILNSNGSIGLQTSTTSSSSILELIKSNKNSVVSLRESYGSKNSIKAMAIDSIKSSLVALANSAYQLNNLSTETATREIQTTQEKTVSQVNSTDINNNSMNINLDGHLTEGTYSFQYQEGTAGSLSLSITGLSYDTKVSEIINNKNFQNSNNSITITISNNFGFNFGMNNSETTQEIQFDKNTTVEELLNEINNALGANGTAGLKNGQISITTTNNKSVSFSAGDTTESSDLINKLNFQDNTTNYTSLNAGTYTLGNATITIEDGDDLKNVQEKLQDQLSGFSVSANNNTLNITSLTTGENDLDQDENLTQTLNDMGFQIDSYQAGQSNSGFIASNYNPEDVQIISIEEKNGKTIINFSSENSTFNIQLTNAPTTNTQFSFSVMDQTILEDVTIQEEYETYTDNSLESIQNFIEQYNKTQSLIKSTTSSGGALQYKQVIKKVNEELNDQIKDLVNSNIGISKNKDGSLSLDTEILKSVDVATVHTKFTQAASNLETSITNILDSNSKFSKEEARIDNIILKNDNALYKLKTNIQNSISNAASSLKNLDSILSTLNSQQTESVSILQEYLEKSTQNPKDNEDSDINTLLETLGYSVYEDS